MYEARNAKLFRPNTGVPPDEQSGRSLRLFGRFTSPMTLEAELFPVCCMKGCEPVPRSDDQNDWHVMVINNTSSPVLGVARTSVYGLDGRLVYSHDDPVRLCRARRRILGWWLFLRICQPVHFVAVEAIVSASGRVLSSNFYWRSDPAHVDDFTSLNSLPKVSLEANSRRLSQQEAVHVGGIA